MTSVGKSSKLAPLIHPLTRTTIVAALAASLTLPVAVDAADAQCRTRKCDIRVARKQCERGSVKACIRRAALHRRQDYGAMLRVAWCESRLNPRAANAAHAGLFQFRVAPPSTWATTPYAHRSPYSAKWSSLAAAWMWSVGRKSEWSCR